MEKAKYKVTSKYNGFLTIKMPNTGIKYIWNRINDSRELTLDQLKEILNAPGGRTIIENKLVIEDPEAVKALEMDVEPEYFYSEEDIKALLETGTIEQLEDALNFAPEGTKELIAETAVKIKIENRDKIALITEKTGRDINDQIKVEMESSKEDSAAPTQRQAPLFTRKTNTPTTETTQSRYKRVSK